MKLFQKKKKDNKGFSLVELIVVVAIMAVLMGILVPTLVKNVEKSKKQKDESAIEEIRSQMQNSLADPEFSSVTATIVYKGKKGITITSPTSTTLDQNITTQTELTNYLTEVAANVEDFTFTSKTYKADDEVTFVIADEKVKVYRHAKNETAPGAASSSAADDSSAANS